MRPSDIIEEAESYNQPSMALKMLTLALEALSSRALVWVGFLAAAGLWYMTMMEPTTMKIVTAVGFCLTVLVPVLVRDSRG